MLIKPAHVVILDLPVVLRLRSMESFTNHMIIIVIASALIYIHIIIRPREVSLNLGIENPRPSVVCLTLRLAVWVSARRHMFYDL